MDKIICNCGKESKDCIKCKMYKYFKDKYERTGESRKVHVVSETVTGKYYFAD